MADWTKIKSRGTVSDRRGVGGLIGGGGIVTVLLLMGVTYFMGGNPLDVLLQTDPAVLTSALNPEDPAQYEGEDSYEQFVGAVLGSANDYWTAEFLQQGKVYSEPSLILFRGRTSSECGGASSVVGPHYCPLDNSIYLDETFFGELTTRLGATGGDVAEAYVIAHEVGHHVQNQLGLLSDRQTNEASINTELQADCFAGLWAASLKDMGIFETNEIQEALNAASSVGDDSIQKRTQGEIQPESWTHGSSEDRVSAFTKGYESGMFQICM